MAQLSGSQRAKLRSSQFVFPQQRGFPIDTKARARSALSRCHQAKPAKYGMSSEAALCRKVQDAVAKKFPGIKVTKTKRSK